MTTSSLGPSRNRGSPPRAALALEKAYATRLIASVEFLVNTTSSRDGALMNAATLVRAFSYASVDSAPSVWMARATLALCRSKCSRIASITWRGFCEVLALSRYTSRWPLISRSRIGKSARIFATSSRGTCSYCGMPAGMVNVMAAP
jgi:hypothetical protein